MLYEVITKFSDFIFLIHLKFGSQISLRNFFCKFQPHRITSYNVCYTKLLRELYAIRTELYQPVPEDTIIDDFVISLQIARQKYHIQYRADAFAVESPSVNIREELKRKIRIASGGIQTTFRYPAMLNPLQYGLLSLQYLSHKVLRWLVIPLAIPILLVLNLSICYRHHWSMNGYLLLLLLQLLFYLLTATGWVLQQRNIRWKPIFFPFYISVMNYAQIAGLIRFCRSYNFV